MHNGTCLIAIWEAETGGQLEPRSSGPLWATVRGEKEREKRERERREQRKKRREIIILHSGCVHIFVVRQLSSMYEALGLISSTAKKNTLPLPNQKETIKTRLETNEIKNVKRIEIINKSF
jgi:hypothetical protein